MLLEIFLSYVLPFLFGVFLIGAMMERTLTVLRGQLLGTAGLSVLISSVYWFNIQYVVNSDIPAYISFSVGTLLVTCWQSYREKKRKEERDAVARSTTKHPSQRATDQNS